MTAGLAIAFAGTPDFSVPALDAIAASRHRLVAVYTQPDRPAGRGLKLVESPVKQRARALGLPVEQPSTLRSPEAASKLAAYAADVLVVVAYGLILPQAILDVPRHGCLNIHASLLPRWRGAAPIQRALLAGDAETGITIMRMEAGLDTGPMLVTERTPITPEDTGGSLHDRLAEMGGHLIVEALDRVAAGTALYEPQDGLLATYAHKIDKHEALVDWRRPAPELARLVRAFNPWPVAETRLAGEQLRIWAARPADTTAAASPGTVLEAGPQGITVMTGSGTLVLDRVQVPGRKPVAARDLANSRDLRGAVLG